MPTNGSAAQFDNDSPSGLRDEDLLVSRQIQAALNIRRNPQNRAAPTPRKFAPQLERLAPDSEPACDPDHPLTLLLGDELFPAGSTPKPLLHEGVPFDLGGDVVGRDEPPLPTVGAPHGSTIP